MLFLSEKILRLASLKLKTKPEVGHSGEVSVVGRLGKFGLGIMKKKAETLGREFACSIQRPSLSGFQNRVRRHGHRAPGYSRRGRGVPRGSQRCEMYIRKARHLSR